MGLIGGPVAAVVRARICGLCTPVFVFSGGGSGGSVADVGEANPGRDEQDQAPSVWEETEDRGETSA